MIKNFIIVAAVWSLLGIAVASAQMLSSAPALTANGKAKTVAPAGASKNLSNKQTPNKVPENGEASLPSASKKADVENPHFAKSIKNIDNYDTSYDAKKYDNTYGQVFTFHLKNGHIEFDKNDDRKILVWYENFNVIKGMDGMARCSIRVFVLNDLKTRINNLGFKIIWPDIRTSINMTKVNPGVNTYIDTMLIGDGCFTMDRTPVIEVNRCRVKGMSEDRCADAVHWFNKH